MSRSAQNVRGRLAPSSRTFLMAQRLRSVALPWTRLSDEGLLQLRLCDLRLSLERSPVKAHVRRLYSELAGRGIRFRPHVWLCEEWVLPARVPGLAGAFF